MIWQLAIAMATGFLAADVADEASKKDIERWQGTWHMISMEADGKVTPPEKLKKITLSVTGTDYHFRNGDFSEHGVYKFAASKSPKELDIVVGEGADKGKVYLTIYRIEGDELAICLEGGNKNRPKQFDGKAGSGCVLEIWRRARP